MKPRGGVRRGLLYAAPALVLLLGALGRTGVRPEREMSLREPLDAFPSEVAGYEVAKEERLSGANLGVLRPDSYMLRSYASTDVPPAGDGGEGEASAGETAVAEEAAGREVPGFTLFVAWYGRQTSGSTVHSPRNCLPGSGWEPTRHDRVDVRTPYGAGRVNRYLVEHESGSRALVYYWYQGRGRVAASEYAVKWDLLSDAVLRRRTDEALVRIVVPLGRGEEPAGRSGLRIAEAVAGELAAHLPG